MTVVEGVIAEALIAGGSEVFGLDGLLQPIRQERPARLATMERQLLLINERPGVKVVDTTLDETVPGSGRFRLTVKVETWRLYGAAGLDNMGSVSSGPWQGSANLALNSLVLPGDSLSVSGSFVPGHPRELRYGRLAYELPLAPTAGRSASPPRTARSGRGTCAAMSATARGATRWRHGFPTPRS